MVSGILNTKYVWKELTDDGRLISPKWANEFGYEHEAEALVHYYMKFATSDVSIDPKYLIVKLYGV